jgi:hypothetical protein
MKRIRIITGAVAALLIHPTAAFAETTQSHAQERDCAIEAQQAIARRHSLPERDKSAIAFRIYKDPNLALEAEVAFDACMKKKNR